MYKYRFLSMVFFFTALTSFAQVKAPSKALIDLFQTARRNVSTVDEHKRFYDH